MTTENERERAQLDRNDDQADGELTLFVGRLVSEYPGGAMQVSGLRKATPAEARALLKKRKEAGGGPASRAT